MPARFVTACLLALFCLGGADARAAQVPDFAPATQLSPPLPHPHFSDPNLTSRDGRTLAVWTKTRYGTRSWAQVAELDAAGRPGPVTSMVAAPDSGYDNDPVASISSTGTAAVVWRGAFTWLTMLDPDLSPGPAKSLGTGMNDPVVSYPATGDGLIAWGGPGGIGVATITPSGQVGTPSTIPVAQGFTWAPAIEFDQDGGHVYFMSSSGILAASLTDSGGPGPVRELLPPPGANGSYRNLVVSGDLLVILQERVRGRRLICVPLSGGEPRTIDSGSLRIDSIDVDIAGRHGLIGWAKSRGVEGARVARAATVDQRCRVSRTAALPAPGRRAYAVRVGHDGRSPLALVAGGGGLEAVRLSRSGNVRGSERIRRTKPFSKKLEQRTPVNGLQLLTGPDTRPTAVWTQSHRGPGQTIAASVAR